MEQFSWWLTQSQSTPGGMLLLVAVDAVPRGPGAYPCRVMGAVSPLDMPQSAPEIPADTGAPSAAHISHLLTDVGVPANLLGFVYLCTGLSLALGDPALRRCITRTLYPRIAEQHGTSARSVERAIRHAIAATWERTGGSEYRKALGRLASFVGERPTNSEFIAQLSERLRLEDG